MKRIAAVVCLGIFLLTVAVFAKPGDEPKFQEFQKTFKKDFFDPGILMQYVFDYQGTRTQSGNNGFSIENMRLKLKGKFDRGFGYVFQTKFNKAPAILDAYMTWQLSHALILQMGQFKAPFSKEYLTSSAKTDFVNRARAISALVPGRQIGFQLSGNLARNVINYRVAVCNGNSTKENNNDDGKFLYAARIAFYPKLFNEGKDRGLELGLNGAISKDTNVNLVNGQLLHFGGDRRLWGSDIRLTYEKFLFAGEYVRADLEPNKSAKISPNSFHLTGAYMLLPEIQVLLRWDQFDLDRLSSEAKKSDWFILGLNIFPTSITKLQVNYIADLNDNDLKKNQILINAQISF